MEVVKLLIVAALGYSLCDVKVQVVSGSEDDCPISLTIISPDLPGGARVLAANVTFGALTPFFTVPAGLFNISVACGNETKYPQAFNVIFFDFTTYFIGIFGSNVTGFGITPMRIRSYFFADPRVTHIRFVSLSPRAISSSASIGTSSLYFATATGELNNPEYVALDQFSSDVSFFDQDDKFLLSTPLNEFAPMTQSTFLLLGGRNRTLQTLHLPELTSACVHVVNAVAENKNLSFFIGIKNAVAHLPFAQSSRFFVDPDDYFVNIEDSSTAQLIAWLQRNFSTAESTTIVVRSSPAKVSVLVDSFDAPPQGTARVRLFNALDDGVFANVSDGALPLFLNVTPGQLASSGPVDFNARVYNLTVSKSDGTMFFSFVNLTAGASHTCIILASSVRCVEGLTYRYGSASVVTINKRPARLFSNYLNAPFFFVGGCFGRSISSQVTVAIFSETAAIFGGDDFDPTLAPLATYPHDLTIFALNASNSGVTLIARPLSLTPSSLPILGRVVVTNLMWDLSLLTVKLFDLPIAPPLAFAETASISLPPSHTDEDYILEFYPNGFLKNGAPAYVTPLRTFHVILVGDDAFPVYLYASYGLRASLRLVNTRPEPLALTIGGSPRFGLPSMAASGPWVHSFTEFLPRVDVALRMAGGGSFGDVINFSNWTSPAKVFPSLPRPFVAELDATSPPSGSIRLSFVNLHPSPLNVTAKGENTSTPLGGVDVGASAIFTLPPPPFPQLLQISAYPSGNLIANYTPPLPSTTYTLVVADAVPSPLLDVSVGPSLVHFQFFRPPPDGAVGLRLMDYAVLPPPSFVEPYAAFNSTFFVTNTLQITAYDVATAASLAAPAVASIDPACAVALLLADDPKQTQNSLVAVVQMAPRAPDGLVAVTFLFASALPSIQRVVVALNSSSTFEVLNGRSTVVSLPFNSQFDVQVAAPGTASVTAARLSMPSAPSVAIAIIVTPTFRGFVGPADRIADTPPPPQLESHHRVVGWRRCAPSDCQRRRVAPLPPPAAAERGASDDELVILDVCRVYLMDLYLTSLFSVVKNFGV